MFLETKRLLLIPYTLSQMTLAIKDPGSAAYEIGALHCPYPAGEAGEKKAIYASKIALMREMPSMWLFCTYWEMVLKDTRLIIGELGFKGPPCNGGSVEIGYGVREAYRNIGLMSEAVDALCMFAFSRPYPAVLSVTAETLRSNIASHRVLEKCGFSNIGSRDELLVWSRPKQR